MKIIDLHPEELIDRARRGELTAEEQTHLDHHVARCSACRFELMLRDDFAAEAGLAGSGSGLHALVSSALVAAGEPAAPSKPRRHVKAWSLGVAAAILLMTGMATAQLGVITQLMTFVVVQAKQAFGAEGRETKAPQSKRVKTSERAAKRERSAARPNVVAPSPAPSSAPVVAVAPVQVRPGESGELEVERRDVQPAPSEGRVLQSERASSRSARWLRVRSTRAAKAHASGSSPAAGREPADAPATGHEVPRTSAEAEREEPAPVESPALLFERANGLRREGFASEARSLYRHLETHFARSPEGRLALAVLGRLELDRGDAAAALRDFEAYLATGDVALREEVLAGRALAFGRLGQHSAECSAFSTLLRAYPESTYGSVAKRRCD